MSSCSASMSEVMRGDEPAGLLASRRSRATATSGGGTRGCAGRAGRSRRCAATRMIASRPRTSADDRDDEVRAPPRGSARRRRPPAMPASMPYAHQRGTGEQARRPARRARATATDDRPRYGRSMRHSRRSDLLAPRRGRASPRRPSSPRTPPLTSRTLRRRRAAARLGRAPPRRCDASARRCASTSRYALDVASSSSCVPSATTRPSSSSTTRSASAIVAGRWAMMIVVRPVHHLARARRGSRAPSSGRPTTSRRRGSGRAGRRAPRARSRCAGAARPTASSRARRSRCRSRRGARR